MGIVTGDEGISALDESDIYRSSGMVNTIPENDQEDIKNFKLGYDTKNEAKEILSGYIS